ncbi:RodZ domain-containing protein [Candidatus Endoriftia persephone]|jgi:cytoskeleton protein RodZ|uniref:DUF4115 domain-containing protein n=3 Tax=Gammaproteobacteria TaxID=1236 RepID=A0A9J6ZVL0_9GAMM|nr:RodZ domain-containing protein [Candidatus Endoriftia persephone]EGV51578.1 putative transcriptional regulator [endosymbiont of Riftia pachyptila (vent Ph05)]EGW55629.1 putative transcriptional regulator [endosymbiont of Tevnia jerichonana (vent Tica)]USF86773.1 DUF4115 domain-containing protein [Candidatus Endoriftia persephone]
MSVLSTKDAEQMGAGQPIEGPGSRLRKEREALGIDQMKLAAQLHLSETMIEALEWDDYEVLPSPVFVQGYLKNYARILGVPEHEVIDAYRALAPLPEEARALNGNRKVLKEMRSNHGGVRIVTWVIVIALLLLLAIWWQGEQELHDMSTADQATLQESMLEEGEAAPDNPGLSLPPPLEVTPKKIAPATEIEPPTPQDEAAVVEPPPLTQTLTEETTQVDAREPVGAAAEIAAEQSAEVVVEALQEAAPTTSDAVEAEESVEVDAAPAEPGSAFPSVVIEFNDSCWAEIRDASGRTRLIGNMKVGDRRVLGNWPAPYRVLFGNAGAVNMSINGDTFDLEPHTRRNVARFRFDPADY